MNDIFRLVFSPADTVPDVPTFEADGASVHGSLVEAVKAAMRASGRERVPFICSSGIVIHPNNIEVFAAELAEHGT